MTSYLIDDVIDIAVDDAHNAIGEGRYLLKHDDYVIQVHVIVY